ncbi:MAG: hypothetical protein WC796_05335 [Candidatus Pacearchaeota archaeon]|jgi:hypothetical protein
MKNIDKKAVVFVIVGSIFIALISFVIAQQNDTQIMTVEANILTGLGGNESNQSFLKISVPDHIFLGNATIGQVSNETKVIINNTGTIKPIIITAELADPDKDIFNYLQIKDGSYKFIDEFVSSNITYRKTLYLRFDLRDFDGDLDDDLMGYTNQVRFIAMEA